MKLLVTICLFLSLIQLTLPMCLAAGNDIRIGVLTTRGPEDTLKSWQQVADYLNVHIPEHHFIIIPITYKEMERAVAEHQLEFVVANPAQYIEFEVNYGASRVATQINHVLQSESSQFGSVIFTKANRRDIVTLADLKGKSFVAASKTAFASWVVAREELKRNGISARDLSSVQFTGLPTDDVVLAVKNCKADAGAVRTSVLEQMAHEGTIVLSDFRVINQKHEQGFPFLLSSDLYPEFAFARLKNTDRQLANKVAANLLLMPHDNLANSETNQIGWTVPDNYEKVRTLLQDWKLTPYENFGKVTLKDAIRQHWVTISLALVVFIALSLITFLGFNIKNRKKKFDILQESKQKLDLIHAMIVATPDAIFIKDSQGRYVFVNPEAARIIGKPIEEIIGKYASDFFPLEAAQAMAGDDGAVMSSTRSKTYEELLESQEKPRYMLITKGPMYNDEGEVDGVFGVARDITDLKLLQMEITEKVAQLETALSTVRQLEGIIPICSYCKKIRDDEKSWHQMEQYISSHSEARFSHGICPDCYESELRKFDADD